MPQFNKILCPVDFKQNSLLAFQVATELAQERKAATLNLRGKGTLNRRGILLAGAIAIFLVLSWRGECWAYIDPNAGGFLSKSGPARVDLPFVSLLLP